MGQTQGRDADFAQHYSFLVFGVECPMAIVRRYRDQKASRYVLNRRLDESSIQPESEVAQRSSPVCDCRSARAIVDSLRVLVGCLVGCDTVGGR
jgi:hypothetical protein